VQQLTAIRDVRVHETIIKLDSQQTEPGS